MKSNVEAPLTDSKNLADFCTNSTNKKKYVQNYLRVGGRKTKLSLEN